MTAPLLTVEDVSLRLWRGTRSLLVIDDISLELGAGEFGGVWADRSVGKTTLARVLAGAVRPDAGRVLLDGRQVSDAGDPDAPIRVHPDIGLASRRGPAMPDLPVEEWIAHTMIVGCSWREALRQAAIALDRVGAQDVGSEPWSRLADSERTLVAIAYAIARGPRLLIVDDLVAGLGPFRRETVLSLLHRVVDTGVTVLMTSTDAGDFKGADRIWSLEAGRLIESAPRPDAEVVPLRPTGLTSRQ